MKILVILGHPARKRATFCGALVGGYINAAKQAGHEVSYLAIAEKQFYPMLHEGYSEVPDIEPDIAEARRLIVWAEHIVFVYPLWEFMIPALLKGFLERTLILGGVSEDASQKIMKLNGKTIRLIQTSGMPGFVYRLYFMAHGAKALRDMLRFCGARSVKASYLGSVESAPPKREKMLLTVSKLGKRGG